MEVGDLIKFVGTWAHPTPGERETGIIMKIWYDGRTGKQSCCEVLWDNGDYGRNHNVRSMEVISESR